MVTVFLSYAWLPGPHSCLFPLGSSANLCLVLIHSLLGTPSGDVWRYTPPPLRPTQSPAPPAPFPTQDLKRTHTHTHMRSGVRTCALLWAPDCPSVPGRKVPTGRRSRRPEERETREGSPPSPSPPPPGGPSGVGEAAAREAHMGKNKSGKPLSARQILIFITGCDVKTD